MQDEYTITTGRTEDFLQLDHFQRKSVSFIREVKATHGTEKASQIVSAFADVLGREWSNKLILDMVAGGNDPHYENSLKLSALNFESLISMIKALRTVSSMGLREARDAVVELKDATILWMERKEDPINIKQAPTITFPFKMNPAYGESSIESGYKLLREVGFHIHE